jgi:hypothetical protein
MKNALIGYSGFVGGNLESQRKFEYRYNSKNFREMRGQSYDEVVCAGVSAVKWLANKEPEKDAAAIQELQDVLSTVKAKRFILISTIDVYPITRDKDETFDCKSIENHAYGDHRLEFEDFCTRQFSECYVIRLPGLFGAGLKKNVIYDLLEDNCLDMINVASSFQYYDLVNLWSDIEKIIESDIRLINIFTEPVSTGTIIDRFFPGKTVGESAVPEVHYDLKTCYARLWGKKGPYAYSSKEIMAQLEQFIETCRIGTVGT